MAPRLIANRPPTTGTRTRAQLEEGEVAEAVRTDRTGGEGDRPQQADPETEAHDTATVASHLVVTLELHCNAAVAPFSKEPFGAGNSTETYDQ